MVDAAPAFPDALRTSIGLIRDFINWPEQISDARRNIQDLRDDLPVLLHEFEHVSHMCRNSVHGSTVYESERLQVERVARDVELIKKKMQKKRHKCFPSVTNDKIKEVQTRVKDLSKGFQKLREDAENKREQARREGEDYLSVGNNYAPMYGPEIVLDFDIEQDNGERRTFEGMLLDAVLSSSSSSSVTVCALGPGGVGKTCALHGVAHHPEVKKRFWGGVYYDTLGPDARKEKLRELIVEMVKNSGGTKKAIEISALEKFEKFVISAGQWFEPYPYLFLIDDVWFSDGSDVRDFELVRNLARHPSSRVAFTTRNKSLSADKKVLFDHREESGKDSRKILVKTAGFEAEPNLPCAMKAFKELLRIGNGLPLRLSLIGGGVRHILKNRSSQNPEIAWSDYHAEGVKELKNERDVLMRSLSFLDKGSSVEVHQDRFKSLSVLRPSQKVKIDVVRRIWGLNEAESKKEADLLGLYHIVQLHSSNTGGSKGGEISLSLHDVMLKIAREEAERDGFLRSLAQRVISSYLSDARGATTTAVSIYRALVHPEIKIRFGLDSLGMVCAVGSSFANTNVDAGSSEPLGDLTSLAERWPTVGDDGYFYENLCWLLSNGKLYDLLKWLIWEPQWLIRQLKADGSGLGQVQDDLDIVSLSLAGDTPYVEKMKRCIELLKSTIIDSKVDLISSKWQGMRWFQFHGRLSHFADQSEWVRDYVDKIEQLAPRPWYKPSVGCLLPASMSLQEIIPVGGRPKCVALVDSIVSCCYQEVSGNIILQQYDLCSTTCEQLVLCQSTPDSLCDIALSGDGRTVVICLESGDILLRHLDLGAQPEVNETETTETMSNQPFVRDDKNVKKRCKKFIKNGRHRDQKFKAGPGLRLVGNHKYITCLAISQSGEKIISGGRDRRLRVWKTKNGKWKNTVLKGHNRKVGSVSMSGDGTQFVSGYDRKTALVWKMGNRKWKTGNRKWKSVALEEGANSYLVSMSADGTTIVDSGTSIKNEVVWKMTNGEWRTTGLQGYKSRVSSLSVSANGTEIMSGYLDNTVRLWKLRNEGWDSTFLEGHTERVECVGISANGIQIVSGSEDSIVRVWQVRGRDLKKPLLKDHTSSAHCVSVSGDEAQVVSASYDGTLRVWRERDGGWECTVLERETDFVNCVASSVDGSSIVYGSFNGTVRLWRERDGEWESIALKGFTELVTCVAVSANGSFIVSGSWDRSVRVWTERDREWKSIALKGHTEEVSCVAVSADGTLIVSGGEDKSVRVWTERNREWEDNILDVLSNETWLRCISTNADGSVIVYGTADGTVGVCKKKGRAWDRIALEGNVTPIYVSVNTGGTHICSGSLGKQPVAWKYIDEKWVKMTEPAGMKGNVAFNVQELRYDLARDMKFPLNEIFRVSGGQWYYPLQRAYLLGKDDNFVRIDKIM